MQSTITLLSCVVALLAWPATTTKIKKLNGHMIATATRTRAAPTIEDAELAQIGEDSVAAAKQFNDGESDALDGRSQQPGVSEQEADVTDEDLKTVVQEGPHPLRSDEPLPLDTDPQENLTAAQSTTQFRRGTVSTNAIHDVIAEAPRTSAADTNVESERALDGDTIADRMKRFSSAWTGAQSSTQSPSSHMLQSDQKVQSDVAEKLMHSMINHDNKTLLDLIYGTIMSKDGKDRSNRAESLASNLDDVEAALNLAEAAAQGEQPAKATTQSAEVALAATLGKRASAGTEPPVKLADVHQGGSLSQEQQQAYADAHMLVAYMDASDMEGMRTFYDTMHKQGGHHRIDIAEELAQRMQATVEAEALRKKMRTPQPAGPVEREAADQNENTAFKQQYQGLNRKAQEAIDIAERLNKALAKQLHKKMEAKALRTAASSRAKPQQAHANASDTPALRSLNATVAPEQADADAPDTMGSRGVNDMMARLGGKDRGLAVKTEMQAEAVRSVTTSLAENEQASADAKAVAEKGQATDSKPQVAQKTSDTPVLPSFKDTMARWSSKNTVANKKAMDEKMQAVDPEQQVAQKAQEAELTNADWSVVSSLAEPQHANADAQMPVADYDASADIPGLRTFDNKMAKLVARDRIARAEAMAKKLQAADPEPQVSQQAHEAQRSPATLQAADPEPEVSQQAQEAQRSPATALTNADWGAINSLADPRHVSADAHMLVAGYDASADIPASPPAHVPGAGKDASDTSGLRLAESETTPGLRRFNDAIIKLGTEDKAAKTAAMAEKMQVEHLVAQEEADEAKHGGKDRAARTEATDDELQAEAVATVASSLDENEQSYADAKTIAEQRQAADSEPQLANKSKKANALTALSKAVQRMVSSFAEPEQASADAHVPGAGTDASDASGMGLRNFDDIMAKLGAKEARGMASRTKAMAEKAQEAQEVAETMQAADTEPQVAEKAQEAQRSPQTAVDLDSAARRLVSSLAEPEQAHADAAKQIVDMSAPDKTELRSFDDMTAKIRAGAKDKVAKLKPGSALSFDALMTKLGARAKGAGTKAMVDEVQAEHLVAQEDKESQEVPPISEVVRQAAISLADKKQAYSDALMLVVYTKASDSEGLASFKDTMAKHGGQNRIKMAEALAKKMQAPNGS